MRTFTVGFVALLCVGLIGINPASGEPNPPADKATKPKAATNSKQKPEEILRKMADYLGNLPAFACRVDSSFEIKGAGLERKMESKYSVKLQKPNRIAMLFVDGPMGITLISDGKKMVHYVPSLKRYTTGDAPASLADLSDSDEPNPLSMMGGVPIPTNGKDFYEQLMAGVTKSEYLGTEKVGTVECHHLRFLQENFDWDMWISTGDKPLVYKVAPDLHKQFANGGSPLKDSKITYNVLVTDWNTSPKFTDADFTFTPPANAEKVDSLFEGMNEDEGPHPLLGQPAPPFQTVDLDEHPFDLKTYLGKNVILLDFWATWCGPCVEAMPKVDAVAKKFAPKGLVFRAVNAGEDAKTIKEFLESSKLNPPVVLDLKGEIGPLYKANAIPQTVIIGKDGKVQVVHQGFGPGLDDTLSKEIEDVLAGKDLAGPELKKAEEQKKKRAESKKEPASEKKTEEADAAK